MYKLTSLQNMEFKKVLVLVMFLTMFVILSFHKFIFFNTGKPKIDNVIARDQELTLRFSSKGTYFSTEKSVTGIPSNFDVSFNYSIFLEKQKEIVHVGCNETFQNLSFSQLTEYWQPVDVNTSNSHHVYSAYHHHDQTPPSVRIIGNLNNALKNYSLFCQLWYYNGSDTILMTVSKATAEPFDEGQNLRHRVCFFRCPLPNNIFPFAVSLTSQRCMSPNNLLPVRSHVANDRDKKIFTVCISPLFGRYNLTRELIQWIELNRILGATYFVFYNYSITTHVDKILNFYARKGLAKVVHWNVSQFRTERELHYFGQHAAMNDCLMRMKNISEFVVNCDLDEVLVPHSNYTTWKDIVDSEPNHGGYLFKHSYFRLNWNTTDQVFPDKDIAITYNLYTLLKFRRETKIWRPHHRSKYFCRSSVTERIGTHLIFEFKPGWKTYVLSPKMGLLHHYKFIGNRKPDPDNRNNVSSLIDSTVYVKYRDRLLQNVNRIYLEI